jgi:hypothetical protein
VKTFLIALLLTLVLASNLPATICCGFVYVPPTVDPPTMGGAPGVTGGSLLAAPPTPTLFGPGFLLQGPMDVQANNTTLQLQYSITATFTPQTTTQYWIYSQLTDFIWSNTLGTNAVLDSVTSIAYINDGTCTVSGCTTLATSSTTLGPFSLLFDAATSYSNSVNATPLFSFWGTFSPVGLSAYHTYTLVHQTTFNLSGLAEGEIIRIDLPETSDVTNSPEPATWAIVLVSLGVAGYRRRARQS